MVSPRPAVRLSVRLGPAATGAVLERLHSQMRSSLSEGSHVRLMLGQDLGPVRHRRWLAVLRRCCGPFVMASIPKPEAAAQTGCKTWFVSAELRRRYPARTAPTLWRKLCVLCRRSAFVTSFRIHVQQT